MFTRIIILYIALVFGASFAPTSVYAVEQVCEDSRITSDTLVTVGEAHASLVDPISPYWVASLLGAEWIWESEAAEYSALNLTYRFERVVSIPENVTSVTVSAAADDVFSVFVDQEGETFVGEHTVYEDFTVVEVFEVTDIVTPGSATFIFEVTNFGHDGSLSAEENPAGLLFAIEVTTACDEETSTSNPGNGGAGPLLNPKKDEDETDSGEEEVVGSATGGVGGADTVGDSTSTLSPALTSEGESSESVDVSSGVAVEETEEGTNSNMPTYGLTASAIDTDINVPTWVWWLFMLATGFFFLLFFFSRRKKEESPAVA